MTPTLIPAVDTNAIFDTTHRGARDTAAQLGAPSSTIFAWLSLVVIATLIEAHSGYWSLALPSWLLCVVFLGATTPESNSQRRGERVGGGH